MASTNPALIERYQIEYQKNPRSRIFAPLAEAYWQMGMLDEAYQICSKGVQVHPDFSGGRVVFAKILIAREERQKALEQLKAAVEASPDNLMAHSLLGETLLELRKPKEALEAFKMVLFLNPENERAQRAVKKWEFLSADEYDEDLFQMRPVFDAKPAPILTPEKEPQQFEAEVDPAWKAREIERAVSLADAFTVRNDLERAMQILNDAGRELGASESIERRLRLLEKRTKVLDSEPEEESVSANPLRAPIERKRARLETLLRRIHERRVPNDS